MVLNEQKKSKRKVIPLDVEVAIKLGNSNEALVLTQLDYWIKLNKKSGRNFKNKLYWAFGSYNKWAERDFPFWSAQTVRRAFERLTEKGIVIVGDFPKHSCDKSKWYTINYDKCEELFGGDVFESPYQNEKGKEAPSETEKSPSYQIDQSTGQNDMMVSQNDTVVGHSDTVVSQVYMVDESNWHDESYQSDMTYKRLKREEKENIQETVEREDFKETSFQSINTFKEEYKESKYEEKEEDSISINIDNPISETQYRNLEKDISQNLKLVFRFRNIPEDYFSVCDANPEEELNEILKYFFRKYNSFSRDEKIFTISYEETMQVVKEYFVTEGILFEDSVFRFSDYKEMIDLYFTKHIKNDMEHNLSNFMNETFRKFLYEEIKENRKDDSGTSYYTAPPSGNGDDAPLPFN